MPRRNMAPSGVLYKKPKAKGNSDHGSTSCSQTTERHSHCCRRKKALGSFAFLLISVNNHSKPESNKSLVGNILSLETQFKSTIRALLYCSTCWRGFVRCFHSETDVCYVDAGARTQQKMEFCCSSML